MKEENLDASTGVSLSVEQVEDAKAELKNIKTMLEDSGMAYADTGDSMEFLDELLGDVEWYKDLLLERRAASQKAINGDLEDIKAWVDRVESHF